MTRLALSAALLLSALTTHAAHAQVEPTDDTVAAANDAGVDPQAVAGALNTLADAGYGNLDARQYLIAEGKLAAPAPATARGYAARVRLTYYVQSGVTYCGGHPYRGSTACSWNFACGTRFVFRDGESVVCTDRGLLGSSGWLDVYAQPTLVAKYGQFATVEVE